MTTLIADPKKLSEGDPLTAETLALADQVVLIDVSTGKNALASIEEFAERLPAPDLAIADVDGLQAALDSKATSSSTAASLASLAADIDALETAVDGKAAAVHTHAVADVTGLQAALDAKAAAADLATLETEVDGKASTGSVAALGASLTEAEDDITALQTAVAGKVDSADVGAAGGVASLDGAGKVPVAQLPAVVITDTFTAASQAAMLALSAERGDICVRSDLNKSFVLSTDDPTTLADWIELKTPTDAVLSVAGRTGAIVLTGADISGGSPTFTNVNAAGINSSGGVSANYMSLGGGSLNVSYGGAGFNGSTLEVLGKFLNATRTTGEGAPVVCVSTALCTNLNADQIDGKHAAAFVEHALADAKGDLLVATAADTVARLAVGTNGQVLTADSSAAGGVKWADATGGGGSAIDWDSAAVLRTDGNDTTGTVGDPSKPYLTAQAAYDDGARTLLVCEKSAGNYGAIAAAGNLALHVVALDGVARLGAITAPGYTIQIYGPGAERCSIASVSNSTTNGANAAALHLYNLTVSGSVTSNGSKPATANVGGVGGAIILTNCYVNDSASANGGGGGDGVGAGTSNPGEQGGAAGSVTLLDRSYVQNTISANGGNGGNGAEGDSEVPGGDAGAGGDAGIIIVDHSSTSQGGTAEAIGGATGAGGTNGGAGDGGQAAAGSGGSIEIRFAPQVGALDVTGGASAVSPGAGGSITVLHSDVYGVSSTGTGDGNPSGSMTVRYSTVSTVNNCAAKAGFYVTESSTPYDTWS